LLQKYGFRATFFIVGNSIGKSFGMETEQITEMHAAGMTMGSHTMTHRFLPELSVDQMRYELAESKKILEEILQSPINALSLPGGRENRQVLQLAAEIGYQIVMNSIVGMNYRQSDLNQLKRFAIKRDHTVNHLRDYLNYNCMFRFKFSLKNKTKQILFRLLGHSGYFQIWEKLIAPKKMNNKTSA